MGAIASQKVQTTTSQKLERKIARNENNNNIRQSKWRKAAIIFEILFGIYKEKLEELNSII